MKILMTVPLRGTQGGPQGHLPFLVSGLRRHCDKVDEVVYGSRGGNPFVARRALTVLNATVRILKALFKDRYDILHINTAYDVNALYRDVFVVLMVRLFFSVKIFVKFHGSDLSLLSSRNAFVQRLSQHRVEPSAHWRSAYGRGEVRRSCSISNFEEYWL